MKVAVRPKRLPWFVLLAAGTFFSLWAGPIQFLPLIRLELWVQDRLQQAFPLKTTAPELLLVALDEESITLTGLLEEETAAEPALQMMSREFPWSREVYALLIEKLVKAGARAVVLDVSFPRSLTSQGDAALADALARHQDRVVIAAVFQNDFEGNVSLSLPSESIVPEPWQDRRVGFANFWPDFDNIVRASDDWQSLSRAAGREAHEGEIHLPSLGTAALQQAGSPVPPVSAGSRLIRFARQGSFPIVPLWMVFLPSTWQSNLRGGEIFRDKIVMVGPTAARFRDFHRTPVGEAMNGPEVHLHSMSSWLTGQTLQRVPWWIGVIFCYGAAFGAALLLGSSGSPWRGLGALLSGGLFYGAMVTAVLVWVGWLLPVVLPVSCFATTGLLIFARDFAAERRERARARRTLERYVSRDIVREILDAPSSFLAQLGGVRKDVVVLFSDLRGFTALTEKSDPVALVRQLNEYLARMVDAVFAESGTIDKFIGDAVMATWGTILNDSPAENARRAVRTSARMLRELGILNQLWQEDGRSSLKLGIGLHAGEAVFGNMGSEQKMEPTVIGDTVNLASRTESLCKKYGLPLLFTGAVREHLGPEFSVRKVDLVRVVGRSHAVELFSLLIGPQGTDLPTGLGEPSDRIIDAYRAGDFALVRKLLQDLPPEFAHDPIVEIYTRRVTIEPTTPWNPVHDWTEK